MADTSRAFFENMYRQSEDPWDFSASTYEQKRYATTMLALENRRFARAFEPGCSVGVLTAQLAQICDRLEAIDISPTAVRRARERCRGLANVSVNTGALPDSMPRADFDLIVLSEVGYYFDREILEDIAKRSLNCLRPGGVLLAVHWLGVSADHRLGGDEVHEIIGSVQGLRVEKSERHEGFRLDRWSRT